MKLLYALGFILVMSASILLTDAHVVEKRQLFGGLFETSKERGTEESSEESFFESVSSFVGDHLDSSSKEKSKSREKSGGSRERGGKSRERSRERGGKSRESGERSGERAGEGRAQQNAQLVLNAGVTLAECLDEIQSSADYTDDELQQLRNLIQILQKLGQIKYLGRIVEFDVDFSISDAILNAASELSPCSNLLYQGDILPTFIQMDRILRSAIEYTGVTDSSIVQQLGLTAAQSQMFTEAFSQLSSSASSLVTPQRRKRKVTSHQNELWTLPITYRITPGMNSQLIKSAIREWTDNTCVQFKQTKASLRRLRGNFINFKDGTGCMSNIGKKVRKSGQTITLSSNCMKKYTIAHEIGHALGLWHEQARADRDNKIEVNSKNIPSKYLGQFLAQSEDDVENYGLEYDHGSVMHYASTAYAKQQNELTIKSKVSTKQLAMGQRFHLAFQDAKIINKAYCSDVCTQSLNCKYGGYEDPSDCSRCKCPDGLTGTTCSEVQSGSGCDANNDLTASSTAWTSVSVSGAKSCYWKIKVSGGTVKVKVDSLHFPCRRTCIKYVELKFEKDFGKTGSRFCCSRPNSEFISESENILIIYNGRANSQLTFEYAKA